MLKINLLNKESLPVSTDKVNKKIPLRAWCALHREIQKKAPKKESKKRRTEYKFPLVVNKLAEYIYYRTQGVKSLVITAKELALVSDSLKADDEKKTSVAAIKNRLRVLKEIKIDGIPLIRVRNFGRRGMLIVVGRKDSFTDWLNRRKKEYYALVPSVPKNGGQNMSTYIKIRDINKYYINNITNTTVVSSDLIAKSVFSAIKRNRLLVGLGSYAKMSAFRDIKNEVEAYVKTQEGFDLFAVARFLSNKYAKKGGIYGFNEKPVYWDQVKAQSPAEEPGGDFILTREVDEIMKEHMGKASKNWLKRLLPPKKENPHDIQHIVTEVKLRLSGGDYSSSKPSWRPPSSSKGAPGPRGSPV